MVGFVCGCVPFLDTRVSRGLLSRIPVVEVSYVSIPVACGLDPSPAVCFSGGLLSPVTGLAFRDWLPGGMCDTGIELGWDCAILYIVSFDGGVVFVDPIGLETSSWCCPVFIIKFNLPAISLSISSGDFGYVCGFGGLCNGGTWGCGWEGGDS